MSLSIIVFPNEKFILTFHSRAVKNVSNVLRRIENQQVREWTPTICDGAGGLSPEWISYALIDNIADSFLPLLKYLEHEADSIDDLVLLLKDTDQSEMLRRIAQARKKVSSYLSKNKVLILMRLSQNKPSLLRMLLKLYPEHKSSSSIHLYLADILDHLLTICQALFHTEKSLARSHANYLAQISIEITLASNRTNDVVMKMTALAG